MNGRTRVNLNDTLPLSGDIKYLYLVVCFLQNVYKSSKVIKKYLGINEKQIMSAL